MTFYSQKAYTDRLGSCKDTIAQSGCFITSLCNLALNLNTSKKTPPELNKWLIKNGGYSDGCLLNSAKGAEGVGLVSKGRTGINPEHICICETDHWKSKGVPQHFFVYSDGQAIDPLDLNPTWKKNPYKIVSYRVFTVKAPQVPKEKEKRSETIVDPIKVIPALVEAGEITKYEKPMNKDLKSRLSSLAWRSGMMALAVVLETVVQSLSGFGFPPEVTVIVGLVLGEVSKQIRNSLK